MTYTRASLLVAVLAAVSSCSLQANDPPPPLAVRSVAFSPDGKWLAVAQSNPSQGRTSVWDVTTKQLRWTRPETKGVASVAFSPDGNTLATGQWGGDARLLDAATGKVEHTLPGHGEAARVVAFTPDGKTLAVATYEPSVKLWDVAQRKQVGTLTGHTGKLFALTFSADGRRLLSLAEDSVKLWDVSAGKVKHTWQQGGRLGSQGAVLSADGKWAFTGDNHGIVRVWNADTGELRCKLSRFSGIEGLAFNHTTHKLATCGYMGHISLLGMDLGEPSAEAAAQLRRLADGLDDESYAVREEATEKLRSLGLHAERTLDRLLRESSSVEVRIRARRLLRDLLTQRRDHLAEGGRNVWALAFSPDGKLLVTGARDGSVRVWDVAGQKVLADLVLADTQS